MDRHTVVIGIVHHLLVIYQASYIFLFKKTKLDYIYIFIFILINLHWVIFKGECIISYLHKKYDNVQYILGSEPMKMDDMKSVFTMIFPKELFTYYITTLIVLTIVNMFFVLFRNGFNIYLIWLMIGSSTIYTLSHRISNEKFKYIMSVIQGTVYLISLIYFVIFVSKKI